MYCNICGGKGKNTDIFKINICRDCLKEIQTLRCDDGNYDYYKNLIRIVLGYYISVPLEKNLVN